MTEYDTPPLIAPGDLAAATGLLTRLPVRVNAETAKTRGAAAAWAYPLTGLMLGVVCAAFGSVLLWLSVPAMLTAGMIVLAGVVITGAMHEDGLADTADGLWGGWTRDRRLEIMKDSRIGAYGVIALIVSLALRWQALVLLIDHGLMWPALIVAAMVSRAAMVALMAAMPHARSGGLSHAVGRPRVPTAVLSAVIATMGGLLLGAWVLPLGLVAVAVCVGCAATARAKIGGQTGDILGATQQSVEIAMLITIAALAA